MHTLFLLQDDVLAQEVRDKARKFVLFGFSGALLLLALAQYAHLSAPVGLVLSAEFWVCGYLLLILAQVFFFCWADRIQSLGTAEAWRRYQVLALGAISAGIAFLFALRSPHVAKVAVDCLELFWSLFV